MECQKGYKTVVVVYISVTNRNALNIGNLSYICCFLIDFPRDRVPVVLAPLLYPETLDLPVSKLGIDSTTIPFSVCIVPCVILHVT